METLHLKYNQMSSRNFYQKNHNVKTSMEQITFLVM
jgi:hypothetical protein